MTPFGRHIRALRAERGVDQKTMAAALGVSPAYLSALEHGKKGRPPFSLVQKIIQYFELIWDEAESVTLSAQMSEPKQLVELSGCPDEAYELLHLLKRRIGHMSSAQIRAVIELVVQSENS